MSGFFNKHWYGQTLVNPGVYIKRNEQGGLIPPDPSQLVPLFIGDALGGAPNTVLTYNSADAAAADLRGGDLVTAITAAFAASAAGGRSVTQVQAIRLGAGIDAPTQASHTYKDTASGTQEVQSVAITGTATAGTYTATFATVTTTGFLYNDNATTIASKLNANSAIAAAGGVTVTGSLTATPIVVTFVQPGPRTPIALNISGATGATAATTTTTTPGVAAGNPVLAVTSKDYGQYTNGISLAFQPATKPNGGYFVTLAADPTRANKRYLIPHDNTGRQGIKIRYLGAGTAATLTVTRTHLTTSITGASGDNLNIDLTAAQTDTLDKVVAAINAFAGGIAYAADVADVGPNAPANEMDLISGQDILKGVKVTYTGAGSAATLSIALTATDTALTTACTAAAGDNLNVLFGGLSTVADLAAAIAGTATNVVASGHATYTGAKYTVVVDANYLPLPVANVSITPVPIDVLNGSSGGYLPTFYQTTQHLQAVVDYLNDELSAYVTAALVADAGGTTVGAKPLAAVPPTYLTGGTNANANATSWAAAFTAAERAVCQIVVPLTDDDRIHLTAKAHAATMSSPKARRERVAIVGGSAGETKQEAIDRAFGLGSHYDGDYIQIVWPGVTKVDQRTGLSVDLPPYMAAAMKAGLSAALGAGQGATNKLVDIVGLETEVTQDDLGDLINGGVTAFVRLETGVRRGFIIGKDIMTYQEDANFIKSLFIARMASLISSKRVREILEPIIGEPNTKAFEQRCRNILISELDRQVADGLLVATDTDGGWKDLSFSRTTDTVYVSYNARIVTEIDFILIEANASVIATDS